MSKFSPQPIEEFMFYALSSRKESYKTKKKKRCIHR